MPDPLDTSHMQHALRLAQRGLGTTAPNPSVGCIIVKDGRIVGRGWTQPGGRPHAETVALAQAGNEARGATMYVTLEPCNHHGKTPPCADAVIAAGLKRVVIACRDTNAKAAGGLEKLKAAGIEVELGVCEKEARALNIGFFSVIEKGRPFVSLKLATSLDGKITTGDPTQRWLTGVQARQYGWLLRAQHDAIVTGIGTVLADDPEMTCRLPGLEDRSPRRIVLDSLLRIPLDAKILPARIFTTQAGSERRPTREDSLICNESPVEIVLEENDKIQLSTVLSALKAQGITRLMVEAGAALSSAFLIAGLVDRIYWFRAPLTVGGKGLAGLTDPALLSTFQIREMRRLGDDRLDVLERRDSL